MSNKITKLDTLFDDFYSAHQKQDLTLALVKKDEIFNALISKGKKVHEIYNGKKSLEKMAFDGFMKNFETNPNPFSFKVENIRLGNRILFKP